MHGPPGNVRFPAKDIQKPAAFVPAGARVTDPVAVNDILYASTTGKCGGAADGVFAIDLSGEAIRSAAWR